MKKTNFKFFQIFFILILLISCQTTPSNKEKTDTSILSSDNGLLDLSLSTLEQQNLEKIAAAKFLLEARQKRRVIQPEEIENLSKKLLINLALYARQTSNAVGEKIYIRPPIKKEKLDPCLRFVSSEDAQRFFLKKSGPQKDFWNLDPDGDGFACKWNPDQYRKLLVN